MTCLMPKMQSIAESHADNDFCQNLTGVSLQAVISLLKVVLAGYLTCETECTQ